MEKKILMRVLDEEDVVKEKEFGRYIREKRLKRGFTLSQVAVRLEISTNYVSQIERGVREVTDDLVVGFAALYNVELDKLFWMSGKIPVDVRKLIMKDKDLQNALSYIHKFGLSTERKERLTKEFLKLIKTEIKNNHEFI
ncbi:transcriptional regulator with XRE-family HTH domain [Lederbergia galactosidilyticus]|uniref:helix-turn-helix domain-containing protein n=1 Tax=Lederbergia galactosidilytica TaxID=217031 RepID=UPI001AEA4E4D|nr:helix-turn-helix transcriptional regulator [Lederbergia galactosidilytica]MBP1917525.1 transcriptional regulator with XRE-family HTH domain [Lederbergia galactosidilytica]